MSPVGCVRWLWRGTCSQGSPLCAHSRALALEPLDLGHKEEADPHPPGQTLGEANRLSWLQCACVCVRVCMCVCTSEPPTLHIARVGSWLHPRGSSGCDLKILALSALV